MLRFFTFRVWTYYIYNIPYAIQNGETHCLSVYSCMKRENIIVNRPLRLLNQIRKHNKKKTKIHRRQKGEFKTFEDFPEIFYLLYKRKPDPCSEDEVIEMKD